MRPPSQPSRLGAGLLYLRLLSRLFSGHFLSSKSPSWGADTRPGCTQPMTLPPVHQGSFHLPQPFCLPFWTGRSFSPPQLWHSGLGHQTWVHSELVGLSPTTNLLTSLFSIFHGFAHIIHGLCVRFSPSKSQGGISSCLILPGWPDPWPALSPSSPGGNHHGGCSFGAKYLAQSSLLQFQTSRTALVPKALSVLQPHKQV